MTPRCRTATPRRQTRRGGRPGRKRRTRCRTTRGCAATRSGRRCSSRSRSPMSRISHAPPPTSASWWRRKVARIDHAVREFTAACPYAPGEFRTFATAGRHGADCARVRRGADGRPRRAAGRRGGASRSSSLSKCRCFCFLFFSILVFCDIFFFALREFKRVCHIGSCCVGCVPAFRSFATTDQIFVFIARLVFVWLSP